MLLKAGLNKGSGGNTHRVWVYGNSVFSVEPENLIVPGSQALLTTDYIKANRVCQGAYERKEA